jgi:hypothetical protein
MTRSERRAVTGADFEAIDASSLQLHPHSGQVQAPGAAHQLDLPAVNRQPGGGAMP